MWPRTECPNLKQPQVAPCALSNEQVWLHGLSGFWELGVGWEQMDRLLRSGKHSVVEVISQGKKGVCEREHTGVKAIA
jgi:hypothetical protein